MFHGLSRKAILAFALCCLVSLGLGAAVGYGAGTRDLMATAATANTEENPDALGASRIIITDETPLMCKKCGIYTFFPVPRPEGDLICRICGKVIPK